jgi:hypothetical protein
MSKIKNKFTKIPNFRIKLKFSLKKERQRKLKLKTVSFKCWELTKRVNKHIHDVAHLGGPVELFYTGFGRLGGGVHHLERTRT